MSKSKLEFDCEEHLHGVNRLFDNGDSLEYSAAMSTVYHRSIAISLKRIADSLEKSYELTKQSMPQPDANLDAMVAAHEPKYPTQGQELK